MRIVIELRQGEISDVVLNNLYKQTPMQSVFGINMVALHEGQPKLMNLKQMLEAFLGHRREVVTRRTIFDLRKARDRAHVLEGQTVALANIDDVIALIKSSASPAEAKIGLMGRAWAPGEVTGMLERAGDTDTRPDGLDLGSGLVDGEYQLSAVQAQAILDLRLHRLTGLEQGKIVKEYKEILVKIKELSDILANPDRLVKVIRDELIEMRDTYGDKRRTEIVQDHSDLSVEDLIPEEEVVVTLSHGGYAKAQPIDVYQAQKRGGRGRSATKVKDEDFIDNLFIANTHDTILCFSSRGKMYWLKVYQVPQASRGSRGKPIVNLLPLEQGERINAVLPIREYEDGHFVFMATSGGTVKKTPLKQFSRPRASGIIAVDLRGDDKLVDVAITNGEAEILLVASHGKAIRFNEVDVRPMGRGAAGVRGIKLPESHEVIALTIIRDGLILTATENGYGKRTPVDDFPVQGRGGQGVIAIQTTDRNGRTVGALQVEKEDEIMLISSNGTLVRTGVEDISIMGRNTQGVRLIRVGSSQRLVGLARIESIEDEEE
jgi:DNA gyrase subunit A